MDIKCPGCGEYNKLDCGHVECAGCKTSLSGHRYDKETGAIAGMVGLAALVATVHFADEAVSPRRYPIHKEYAIVNECIRGYSRFATGYQLREATAICTCAVEKASAVTPISFLVNKPKDFASRVGDALPECAKSGG